jgi:GDP-L-fucose synthase
MNKNSRIFVAGHKGMVGSAIFRLLQNKGYANLIIASRNEVDLRNQEAVNRFFEKYKPEYIFLSAAKVGGINANNVYRAEFLYDNLAIQLNVIHAAYIHQSEKLLFLGSSCIYPKNCEQPMREESLLSGYLEPTNEPYAIAKITGIKMCEAYRHQYGCNFIAGMPTNLYGPNDNYHLENSHVLPALIRKIHEAKINSHPTVEVWGTGKPLREFLHVDDLAAACYFMMHQYNEASFVNIGSGTDISIKDLALKIQQIVGYTGQLTFNTSKPDGTLRKLMDSTKLNQAGWKPTITLDQGIASTYQDFILANENHSLAIR